MVDASVPPPPPEPSSLADRLTNVIAAPGEVFEEIKNAPMHASNWLVSLSMGDMLFRGKSCHLPSRTLYSL